jgi:endonuclease-8
MPEGDTIHYAAARIRAVLADRVPEEIRTPHPRHAAERWPQRLSGRRVRSIDAHGKHLFVRFDGELTLHSHLRMTGAWGIYRTGQRWRRAPRRAWLVVRCQDWEVVDQQIVAGIGNVWKAETCFAVGIDPWRTLAAVRDDEALALVQFAREHMRRSAREGFGARPRAVYKRAGLPCPRCGTPIRQRGQGEDNRLTFWCPTCQR